MTSTKKPKLSSSDSKPSESPFRFTISCADVGLADLDPPYVLKLESKQFLVGVCMFFGLTLKEGESDEVCVYDYHGLEIEVNYKVKGEEQHVPIDVDDLCDPHYLYTVNCNSSAEANDHLKLMAEDYRNMIMTGVRDASVHSGSSSSEENDSSDDGDDKLKDELPLKCALIGYNHHINVVQFLNDDFIRGFVLACKICSMDPKERIANIYDYVKDKHIPLENYLEGP